ncbi:hypothetical protein Angca_000259, partial [Angiostrongylus cantonensis]
QSLKYFVMMLPNLNTYSVFMPRFFSQQMYSTNIQAYFSCYFPPYLSIHSQIKDSVTVSSTDMVPIQIDGLISTTHTFSVHSLIIATSMQFPTLPS